MGIVESAPLAGQVLLLTGASRGLGAALARAFAAEGCHMCLCARSAEELTRVQAECSAAAGARGGKCITIVADVRSPADCERLVAQCREVLGCVDILCNNAAVVSFEPFERLSARDIQEGVSCNVAAPMQLARLVLPDMLRRGSGTIVNISSVLGFIAAPGLAVYCATKAALNSFTVALRAELRHTGVRVLSICPASIPDTGMNAARDKQQRQAGNSGSSLTWLYEAPLDGVVAATLAQVRLGAPTALVPITLLPVKLAGALQQLAPDWATAAFGLFTCAPGNPFARAGGTGRDAATQVARVRAKARSAAAREE